MAARQLFSPLIFDGWQHGLMNIFEKYPSSTFLAGLPNDSDFFPLRERIVELFRFLDGLEDPHFGQELDRDAHARLWEMMLAKILKI